MIQREASTRSTIHDSTVKAYLRSNTGEKVEQAGKTGKSLQQAETSRDMRKLSR